MAVVAGVDPVRIGAVGFMLSRRRPTGLLAAYFVGGFGVSLIIGGVLVFVLGKADIGKSSSVPPGIEIAVGTLALVVAVLVGTGVAARVRDRVEARRHSDNGGAEPADAGGAHSVEQLPGFEKLPRRAQNALRSESP
jgi:hypothetical protein